MIFKSRQVNNDPQPNVSIMYGSRHALNNNGPSMRFDPRPEFDVTRDPEPWNGGTSDDGPRYDFEQGLELNLNGYGLEFDPRRDQFDTPVNPILAQQREGVDSVADHLRWLDDGNASAAGFTFDQIDHARRVLTRLANFEAVTA